MPRPHPPLTPSSSTDIHGKEGRDTADRIVHLPPTALVDADGAGNSSSEPSASGSDSSYRPASPPSPSSSTRKRSAAQQHGSAVVTQGDFSLPPPPTRSRKIIQMRPGDSEGQRSYAASTVAPTASPTNASKTTGGGQSGGGRKKQNNSSTTAAGRKIARKTAHSLIERRRRSKMNEEFGVLKDMIPACRGQEMHKLAILQASIEYLRYLEQCVADLKAQTTSSRSHQHRVPRAPDMPVENENGDNDEEEDEEMEEDPQEEGNTTPITAAMEPSASVVSLPSLSQITSTDTRSPSVFSLGAGRHYSISSASQASYSPYFHSNQASPAFGPQLPQILSMPPYGTNFGLGSPALKPVDSAQTLRQIAEGANDLSDRLNRSGGGKRNRSEHELDQEAAAALSMLNHDRRSWRSANGNADSSRSGTGMSVRDLLSG